MLPTKEDCLACFDALEMHFSGSCFHIRAPPRPPADKFIIVWDSKGKKRLWGNIKGSKDLHDIAVKAAIKSLRHGAMKVTELAPGLSCTVHFIKNNKEWRQERGLEIDHEYMCIALMPGEGMGLTYEQALQKGLNNKALLFKI